MGYMRDCVYLKHGQRGGKLAVALGTRIRQHRTKAGMSQVRFSELTGFTQGFISRLENGQVELGIGSLRRVSVALGISLSSLFRGL